MHTIWKELPRDFTHDELVAGMKSAAGQLKIEYVKFITPYEIRNTGMRFEHSLVGFLLKPHTPLEKMVHLINPNYILEVVTTPIKEQQNMIGFEIYLGDRFCLMPEHRPAAKTWRYLPISPASDPGKRAGRVIEDLVRNLSMQTSSASQ